MRSRLEPRFLFSFCLVVGQAPRLPAVQNGNRSGCPTNRTRLLAFLNDAWRGVSEKALLQDQLSKRMRFRRSRVEQQRCERVAETSEQPAILEGKIDIGKIAVTSCPTLGDTWNNSAQDFAALQLRVFVFLLCRLGMKRASRLRRIVFCCHRRERAMVRDRDPGTDRNRNAHAAHTCFHTQCWLWSAQTRPRPP